MLPDQPQAPFDIVGWILAYENYEEQTEEELLAGFQYLIDTGLAWKLERHYGQHADALIKSGRCKQRETAG